MQEYIDFLNEQTGQGCPFCKLWDEVKIAKNEHVYLTPARAPYAKDHLLVVPHDHLEHYKELSDEVAKSIFEMIKFGTDLLYEHGYHMVNQLLRESTVPPQELLRMGKSQEHLHIHLIPDTKVTAVHLADEQQSITRGVYTYDEVIEQTQELQKQVDNI